MKPNVLLISASMLSILLCTFHLTDDIVHGWEPGTLRNLYALPIARLQRRLPMLCATTTSSRSFGVIETPFAKNWLRKWAAKSRR
jgi:hypothetical protein